MGFKNIDLMLEELQAQLPITNEYVNNTIQFGKPTDDQIVAWYNIYCMPNKFEVRDTTYPQKFGRVL